MCLLLSILLDISIKHDHMSLSIAERPLWTHGAFCSVPRLIATYICCYYLLAKLLKTCSQLSACLFSSHSLYPLPIFFSLFATRGVLLAHTESINYYLFIRNRLNSWSCLLRDNLLFNLCLIVSINFITKVKLNLIRRYAVSLGPKSINGYL